MKLRNLLMLAGAYLAGAVMSGTLVYMATGEPAVLTISTDCIPHHAV